MFKHHPPHGSNSGSSMEAIAVAAGGRVQEQQRQQEGAGKGAKKGAADKGDARARLMRQQGKVEHCHAQVSVCPMRIHLILACVFSGHTTNAVSRKVLHCHVQGSFCAMCICSLCGH